jgi:hypothetical protein
MQGVGVKPVRIGLHVDELVLHGFSPLDGRRIADAVQAELTRLLAEQGLPQSLMRRVAVDFIDAGEVRMPAAGSARGIGSRLAGGLYRGLKR